MAEDELCLSLKRLFLQFFHERSLYRLDPEVGWCLSHLPGGLRSSSDEGFAFAFVMVRKLNCIMDERKSLKRSQLEVLQRSYQTEVWTEQAIQNVFISMENYQTSALVESMVEKFRFQLKLGKLVAAGLMGRIHLSNLRKCN